MNFPAPFAGISLSVPGLPGDPTLFLIRAVKGTRDLLPPSTDVGTRVDGGR